MPNSLVRVSLTAGMALMAISCATAASPTAPAGPTTVNADLKEFSITLDKTTVPAGTVKFIVKNSGTIDHEFVVLDTDTPAADLTVEGSTVPEDALTVVNELEDIAVGATPTLEVDLDPGHYAIICNVEAHYQGGMHVDLTVQ